MLELEEEEEKRGQTVLLPTESHDFVFTDNNVDDESADSTDSESSSSNTSQKSTTSSIDSTKIQQQNTRNRRRKRKRAILQNNSKQDNTQEEGEKGGIRIHPFALKMINVAKEIGLLFLAIFFTYAALTNEPPKVSKSPSAHPFFPRGSVVSDWYNGDLTPASEYAKEADISFVMFYAPWDARSQAIRAEFEITARYMQKLVRFVAVNCWQPGSECKNQYSKVYSWPVLIAYPMHGRGIMYNGPKSAHYMIRFLHSVMKPLTRIELNDNNALNNYLQFQYDAVIISEVNASPGSLKYNAVYNTALLFLESDPFQEIGFFIHSVHSTSTNNKENTATANLKILLWNETVHYPQDKEWKSTAMLNWILKTLKNKHQLANWIYPVGSKSQQLSKIIQSGPSLLLFTPRNPLSTHIDYYNLLKEVGLEYYNCNYNSTEEEPKQPKRNIMKYIRLVNYLNEDRMKLKCRDVKPIVTTTMTTTTTTTTNTAASCWTNNSCYEGLLKKANYHSTCSIPDFISSSSSSSSKHKQKHLYEQCIKNPKIFFMEEEQQQQQFEQQDFNMFESNHQKHLLEQQQEETLVKTKNQQNKYKTSMLNTEFDTHSAANLLRVFNSNKCRLYQLSKYYHPTIYSPDVMISSQVVEEKDKEGGGLGGNEQIRQQLKNNIKGLGCNRQNLTLTLVAFDSLKYHQFAQRFGVNVLSKPLKTAAIIVDEKMETHHVLEGNITDNSLRQFIYNFTKKSLPRALTTTTAFQKTTNKINSKEDEFKIAELNSHSFLKTILAPNKAIIVLYYSKQCAFCSGISHAFLTAAKSLSLVVDFVKFTRIDGDLNTLPWEYTMDKFPTILFIPSRRKSESRSFPQNLPMTVPNLINFVITNLEPSLKLHAMWSICHTSKFLEDKEDCVKSVRTEILTIINNLLREWRKTDLNQRSKILYKLQKLKSLHLLLANSSADENEIQKSMKRLHRTQQPNDQHNTPTNKQKKETSKNLPNNKKDEL